jgi:hypothetical protein
LGVLIEQRTVSLGARWDHHRNAALKAQVDRVDAGGGSFGTFRNRQPGFGRGGETTLISIATSFVF